MSKLSKNDLMSLEAYSEVRLEFRRRVMEHKKARRIPIGPSVMLHFEDRLIMQYQIQEMLRVEKIFEPEGIQEELDTYNALIPDGANFKATMMIEYSDPVLRAVELTKLIGIDARTYVKVGEGERVYAISDEDLERDNGVKTSSVHFMRFELSDGMVEKAVAGAAIEIGVDHENYSHSLMVNKESRKSLVGDLNA